MDYNSADGGMNGQANVGGGGGYGGQRRGVSREENLERKVFIGGISWDTAEPDLFEYFSRFGEVVSVNIKYDQSTGRSRGFGFIEFGTTDATNEAIKQKIHDIKGKQCEVKRAMSRENKKVFVGGISNDFPAEDLKNYFNKYGEVEEVELPMDKTTNRRRNFVFVVFKDENGANRAVEQTKHLLGDRYCDVKMFQPDARKPPGAGSGGGQNGPPANYMGGGGGYGGGAGQGGPPGPPAPYGPPGGHNQMAGGYGDYNQYWQQYWQYYYGQYYNQYGNGQPGAMPPAPGGYPAAGYGQPAQTGQDNQQGWGQYPDYGRGYQGHQQ
jgi:hypothetical protein